MNLTGKTFGCLEVVAKSDEMNETEMWLCQCECGTLVTLSSIALANGAFDCGCGKFDEKKASRKPKGKAPRMRYNKDYMAMKEFQVAKKSDREAVVYGYEIYECRQCGAEEVIFCEVGIEDVMCKPSPYEIRCEHCGGIMKEKDFCRPLGKKRKVAQGEKYFADIPDEERGILTMKV